MTQEQPKRDWKAVNRKRDKQLNLRLSFEEYEQIKNDAAQLGITVGAYIRKVVLDAPIPRQSARKKVTVEIEALTKILGHLGKVGSNLNQIAKATNSNIPYQERHLQSQLEALQNIRKDIKQALGK